jgi:ubiquinone/menaquinone biosynthesis C-methylase UbiE
VLGRFGARQYDRFLEPVERAGLRERRRRLLTELEGEVLEIGAGTGLGLRHYERAARVVAVEPDRYMREQLGTKLADARVPVEVVDGKAEALPFPDASFDAVVSMLVLCSVEDPATALAEVRRVLRPGGRLVLIEHVRGDGLLGRAQDLLAPLHRLVAGGCRPNRRTADAVRRAGFELNEEPFTLAGDPDVLTRPAFEGVATRRT